MSSLKDLLDHAKAPTEVVSVGDISIPIIGISVNGIAYLLNKFEELRMLLSGRTVEVEKLLSLGGPIVGAIIAAGCGKVGVKDEEEAAAKLPLELQSEFLMKIIKVTLPNGVGPFVDRLNGLMGTFGKIEVKDGASSDTGQGTS